MENRSRRLHADEDLLDEQRLLQTGQIRPAATVTRIQRPTPTAPTPLPVQSSLSTVQTPSRNVLGAVVEKNLTSTSTPLAPTGTIGTDSFPVPTHRKLSKFALARQKPTTVSNKGGSSTATTLAAPRTSQPLPSATSSLDIREENERAIKSMSRDELKDAYRELKSRFTPEQLKTFKSLGTVASSRPAPPPPPPPPPRVPPPPPIHDEPSSQLERNLADAYQSLHGTSPLATTNKPSSASSSSSDPNRFLDLVARLLLLPDGTPSSIAPSSPEQDAWPWLRIAEATDEATARFQEKTSSSHLRVAPLVSDQSSKERQEAVRIARTSALQRLERVLRRNPLSSPLDQEEDDTTSTSTTTAASHSLILPTYTLSECSVLLYSAFVPHRLMALKIISSTIQRAKDNTPSLVFSTTNPIPSSSTIDPQDASLAAVLTWRHVWSYLIESGHVALTLRIALDEQHLHVASAAMEALVSLLSPCSTARAAIDACRERGGVGGVTPLIPTLGVARRGKQTGWTMAVDALLDPTPPPPQEDSGTKDSEIDLLGEDVGHGLLSLSMVRRCGALLPLFVSAHRSDSVVATLRVLSHLALRGEAAAILITQDKLLLDAISSLLLLQSSSWHDASERDVVAREAVRLLRHLTSASPEAGSSLLKAGVLQAASRLLLSISKQDDNEEKKRETRQRLVVMECLGLWRACALHPSLPFLLMDDAYPFLIYLFDLLPQLIKGGEEEQDGGGCDGGVLNMNVNVNVNVATELLLLCETLVWSAFISSKDERGSMRVAMISPGFAAHLITTLFDEMIPPASSSSSFLSSLFSSSPRSIRLRPFFAALMQFAATTWSAAGAVNDLPLLRLAANRLYSALSATGEQVKKDGTSPLLVAAMHDWRDTTLAAFDPSSPSFLSPSSCRSASTSASLLSCLLSALASLSRVHVEIGRLLVATCTTMADEIVPLILSRIHSSSPPGAESEMDEMELLLLTQGALSPHRAFTLHMTGKLALLTPEASGILALWHVAVPSLVAQCFQGLHRPAASPPRPASIRSRLFVALSCIATCAPGGEQTALALLRGAFEGQSLRPLLHASLSRVARFFRNQDDTISRAVRLECSQEWETMVGGRDDSDDNEEEATGTTASAAEMGRSVVELLAAQWLGLLALPPPNADSVSVNQAPLDAPSLSISFLLNDRVSSFSLPGSRLGFETGWMFHTAPATHIPDNDAMALRHFAVQMMQMLTLWVALNEQEGDEDETTVPSTLVLPPASNRLVSLLELLYITNPSMELWNFDPIRVLSGHLTRQWTSPPALLPISNGLVDGVIEQFSLFSLHALLLISPLFAKPSLLLHALQRLREERAWRNLPKRSDVPSEWLEATRSDWEKGGESKLPMTLLQLADECCSFLIEVCRMATKMEANIEDESALVALLISLLRAYFFAPRLAPLCNERGALQPGNHPETLRRAAQLASLRERLPRHIWTRLVQVAGDGLHVAQWQTFLSSS